MKIDLVKVKCAVCGCETEVQKVMSYSTRSTPDLDLKQPCVDPAMNIEECPNCHYCSYRISEMKDGDYPNSRNKDRWLKDETVQEIIELAGDNAALRKCLIMAYRAKCNIESELRYKMLLRASWLTEGTELGKQLKQDAVGVYMEELGEGRLSELLSFADVARMAGEFDIATAFAKAAKELAVLSGDESFLLRACEYEFSLVEKQDTLRHNTSEVDEQE